MSAPDAQFFVQKLLEVLDETWHGLPRPGWEEGWSYYSDSGAGLEQSLGALSAAQAAEVVGNNSVAQQVRHTATGARAFAGWVRGEQPQTDWQASFVVPAPLDEAAWAALQADLWAALGELRTELAAHAAVSESALTSSTGAVAHVVYHLGAIRAKLTVLRRAAGN
jgi:hypothetical protein